MNTHRTVFQMPLDFEPRITSYWLLGFVEGEGSFFVKKDQYKLTFTLTQSTRDLALMESIRDFLYNLPAPPAPLFFYFFFFKYIFIFIIISYLKKKKKKKEGGLIDKTRTKLV